MHHPLPNVTRVAWLRLRDVEEQLSFDLPPLRLVPARSAQQNASSPPANTTPKPSSSKKKKKKKKKQAKPTAAIKGDIDNEMPGLESVLESRSASQPTNRAKSTVPKNSAIQEDSDDSDEPPPLVRASNKNRMSRKAQPKGVADESDDSDSIPALASQAAAGPAKLQGTLPKKSKPSRPEPEISSPDANQFGPGRARLFEALGKNSHMLDSMLKTIPGLTEAVGSSQPAVEESGSSDDDDPSSFDKFQCKLSRIRCLVLK
jgi:hypothetical protein